MARPRFYLGLPFAVGELDCSSGRTAPKRPGKPGIARLWIPIWRTAADRRAQKEPYYYIADRG